MDKIDLEAIIRIIAIIGAFAGFLAFIVRSTRGYTKLEGKVDTMLINQSVAVAARIATAAKSDKMHNDHYQHAAKRSIHEESMPRETLVQHLENGRIQLQNLNEAFKAHSEQDMEVIKDVHDELKDLRKHFDTKAAEIITAFSARQHGA